jgi:hypothetical protein
MAEFEVQAGHLVVHLTALEKAGGMHGDIEVPLGRVREVRIAEDPWPELRGIRAPGTGWPGVIALGTRRGSGTTDFAAVYHHTPAVVVELSGGDFDRLVISSDHADDDAAMIRAAIGMPAA